MIWFFHLLRKLPPSFYLAVLAAAVIAGGLFVWRGKIIAAERTSCMADVLERQNQELRQYVAFLEAEKARNTDFIRKQRKALDDANDEDGTVAPVLRNALERLRD